MIKLMTWAKADGPEARKQALTDLLSYSQAILDSAEMGDWVSAAEIQARRKKALETFFFDAPKAEEADMIAETIHNILDMDAKVTALAKEGKSLLMTQAASKNNQHKQVEKYLVTY